MTPAPNIILVIADDMGYGDFGIFNSQISCTPTLDAPPQLELDGSIHGASGNGTAIHR